MSCCAKCRWRPDQAVDSELALLEHLNLCFSQDDLQSFISNAEEDDRQEFEMEPYLKSYFDLSKRDVEEKKDVITRIRNFVQNFIKKFFQKCDVEKCLSYMVSAVECVDGATIPSLSKVNTITH